MSRRSAATTRSRMSWPPPGSSCDPQAAGSIGRCPFHDDTTPSLSVAGVPGPVHTASAAAPRRRHRLRPTTPRPHLHRGRRSTSTQRDSPRAQPSDAAPSRARGLRCAEVTAPPPPTAGLRHQRARLAAPVRAGRARSFAEHYLLHHRGIDLTPAARQPSSPARPLVGYAGHGWTTLVDALRRDGVTARRADRHGPRPAHPRRPAHRHPPRPDHRPVPDADHRIQRVHRPGHQRQPPRARSTATPPAPPPSTSPSTCTGPPTTPRPRRNRRHRRRRPRRPRHRRRRRAAGRSRQFAPCAANGVTVSAAQVGRVLGLAREAHCVIALDGDQAGRRRHHPMAPRSSPSATARSPTNRPARRGATPPTGCATTRRRPRHLRPPTPVTGRQRAAAPSCIPARLTRLAVEHRRRRNTTAGASRCTSKRHQRVPAPHPPPAPAPTSVARWLLEQSESR